ncbi:MAG: universal stress protein [Acidiferrobacterales bacterium]
MFNDDAVTIRPSAGVATTAAAPLYKQILVALDSSDHAGGGMDMALALASLAEDTQVTGVHVYGAKLHDVRFRQMEGGLPERYREETELEQQREVHDDLITRGLSIITDSYLDQAERGCRDAGVAFTRRSLEGKNYRELVRETNSDQYDLLIIGARGLGAIGTSRLGTVCERVVRRSNIDTLVIKDPSRSIAEGPIVVAVDGSAKAYGALLTALSLAKRWGAAVRVVAAFDPYFHYVAFNRIAGVLSEEAGKVFRFKDQEKLHEEIIDAGLAKIYQGHLTVAESIAGEYGVEVETTLLDGKPHDAIGKYLYKVHPSLLLIGKLGIHADPELDIGGNAENLLRNVDCTVLLSQREHRPRVDVVAEATTSWTREAEQRMAHVPTFVRNMARMAILRYAQERGHTVITERIVDVATATLCPSHAREAMAEIVAAHEKGELGDGKAQDDAMAWTASAATTLNSVDDLSVRENIQRRAQKKARQVGSRTVEKEHVEFFLSSSTSGLRTKDSGLGADNPRTSLLHWDAAALARLAQVPEGFMRDVSRKYVEDYACEQSIAEITLDVAEAGLERARDRMEHTLAEKPAGETNAGGCPFGHAAGKRGAAADGVITWQLAADERVQTVPEGFMRSLTRQRVEAFARRKGAKTVTLELLEEKYAEWGAGSERQRRELPWDDAAWGRVQRIPGFVRGMVIKEMERCARELGMDTVTTEVLAQARDTWSSKGTFHSDANPGQYSGK